MSNKQKKVKPSDPDYLDISTLNADIVRPSLDGIIDRTIENIKQYEKHEGIDLNIRYWYRVKQYLQVRLQ